MSKSGLTAVKLRYILVGALALLFGLGVALFYFGYNLLTTKAEETSVVATMASGSDKKVQELTATKKQLEQNTRAFNRASQIVADSQSYVYQDQIIGDLNRIAAKSGIEIIDITFSDTTVVGGTPAGGAAQSPAAGSSSVAPRGGSATPQTLAGGVKAVTTSIRISEKVEYDKMLDFLYAIEQNLTKMSISQLSLRKSESPVNGKPAVATDQLTIEVYVR